MSMIKEELPDLSWLEAYRTDSPNFGLERMERMLALRGNPHLQLSVIHITGRVQPLPTCVNSWKCGVCV